MSSFQVNFINFRAAESYFAAPNCQSIESRGKGLEELIELRTRGGCTDAEFLELHPARMIKEVSQAAKKAGLYRGQLDQVIRPLRRTIKKETERAERALFRFPKEETLPLTIQSYLENEENQTIGRLAVGLEKFLDEIRERGQSSNKCSAEQVLSLEPEKLGKKLSQAAKAHGIYQDDLKKMIQSLRERIGNCADSARSVLCDAHKKRLEVDHMIRTLEKAIKEHREKAKTDEEKEAFIESVDFPMDFLQPKTPLQCRSITHEAQGLRKTMEDAHFSIQLPSGILMGVLDGHGGSHLANYAAKRLQELFQEFFEKSGGDLEQTFTSLFETIEQEAEANPEYTSGTTVVVSFIDRKTHCIYTATLGDSEATIYRSINGKWKAIPISCLRDWSSKSEIKRILPIVQQKYPGLTRKDLETRIQQEILPQIRKDHPGLAPEKLLRYPSTFQYLEECAIAWNRRGGTNISRTLGDKAQKKAIPDIRGISIKPKITICQLKSRDLIILACDGLKDYVPEEATLAALPAPEILDGSFQQIPKTLVGLALNDYKSTDNVTVLAAQVFVPDSLPEGLPN